MKKNITHRPFEKTEHSSNSVHEPELAPVYRCSETIVSTICEQIKTDRFNPAKENELGNEQLSLVQHALIMLNARTEALTRDEVDNIIDAARVRWPQSYSTYITTQNKRYQAIHLDRKPDQGNYQPYLIPELRDNIILCLEDVKLHLHNHKQYTELSNCLNENLFGRNQIMTLADLQKTANEYYTEEEERILYWLFLGLANIWYHIVCCFSNRSKPKKVPFIKSRAAKQLQAIIDSRTDAVAQNEWSYEQACKETINVCQSLRTGNDDLDKLFTLHRPLEQCIDPDNACNWFQLAADNYYATSPLPLSYEYFQSGRQDGDPTRDQCRKKLFDFVHDINQLLIDKQWVQYTDYGQPQLKNEAVPQRIIRVLTEKRYILHYTGSQSKEDWEQCKRINEQHGNAQHLRVFNLHNPNSYPVLERGLMMHDFLLTEDVVALVNKLYERLRQTVCNVKYTNLSILAYQLGLKLSEKIGQCGELIMNARINTCHDGESPLPIFILQRSKHIQRHWADLGTKMQHTDHRNAEGQTAYQWLKAQPKVRTHDGREVLANEHHREIFRRMDKGRGRPGWKYSACRFTEEDSDLKKHGRLQISVLNKIDNDDYFDRNIINQARETPPGLEAEEPAAAAATI